MEAAAAAVNKMQRLDDLIAKLQAKVRLSLIPKTPPPIITYRNRDTYFRDIT
jgi:hypothetical protein